MRQGVHSAPSKSITVAKAADDWLTHVEREGRRGQPSRSTEHARRHIIPRIGELKLAHLTTVRVSAFRDDLLADLSRPLAKKVLTSLKSILREAQRRGNVAQNVAEGVSVGLDKRTKRSSGPAWTSLRKRGQRLIDATSGKWRPLVVTAVFAGLRASELRGLRWEDIDFGRRELHVRQRADRYNVIGKPKSKSGERTIPLGPFVANTLREWKLACPKGEGGLVFPTGKGQ